MAILNDGGLISMFSPFMACKKILKEGEYGRNESVNLLFQSARHGEYG